MKTLFLALLILITPVMAWPHPGKTDSVGGHKCYKSCEKWELLFGEYHLHDKYGKPVRVARKVKKERSIVAEPPAAPVQEEQVEMQQPIQAAIIPQARVVQPEKGLSTSPFVLLLLALLLLLLLIRRRARERR